MSKREEALTCTLFLSFLGSLVLCTSCAAACIFSVDSLEEAEQVPQQVLDRFCNPEPEYDPLLLIQAAIDKGSPVPRAISARRDVMGPVQNVRLYQFDKDGDPHPNFLWQSQAVIGLEGISPWFEARVKGRDSFTKVTG